MENYDYQYEISIIVITYNADFNKLRKTLLSALFQQNIEFEIIVTDDGSENNNKAKIVKLFEKYNFRNYKLVMNSKNKGTIRNYLSGISVAEGEYTKVISPGDYFSGSTVLHDWLSFIKRKKNQWSFSEIIYYQMIKGTEEIVPASAIPLFIKPYISGDERQIRWNYLVLDDLAVGCAMLGKTSLLHRYLIELSNTNNLYAEDNIYRMMMFDGIVGVYYPSATLFYEYGTGISTANNRLWFNRLFKEMIETNILMSKRSNQDNFQKRLIKCMTRQTIPFLFMAAPIRVIRYLLLKHKPRMFPVDFEAMSEWRLKCR